MDVRAIILLGGVAESSNDAALETFNGTPLALQDVLGRSVLQRIVDRLVGYGAAAVTVIAAEESSPLFSLRAEQITINHLRPPASQYWRVAESSFCEFAQDGCEEVLLWRVGGYAEVDFDDLLQRHLDSRCHVSSAINPAGQSLDIYLISASRRNEAAFLFRHQLRKFRTTCAPYRFSGYWNALQDAQDLRRLAIDGLLQRAQVAPYGKEVRPGVWQAETARVHQRARVLAPAFIGERAKVRSGAVVTRCSVLEHHAVVGRGAVVEDSTVLPYTAIGPGLDILHSVVSARRVAHLKRKVEVEVEDGRLLDPIPRQAPVRLLGSVAALASFLPWQFLRGLFAKSHREQPAELPSSVTSPAAALNTPAVVQAAAANPDPRFPAEMMVARRYGND